MEESRENDSYPLSITFVGWTSSFALTSKWNERLRGEPRSGMPGHCPTPVGAPPGDYAILTITNQGQQFLRFDSVGVEFELNGAWANVNPKNWWGLHGTGWISTRSDVHLLCPAEVPCNARWRIRYTCDVDPDPSRSPHEPSPGLVAPVLMVSILWSTASRTGSHHTAAIKASYTG
jgi:hypothetical protein